MAPLKGPQNRQTQVAFFRIQPGPFYSSFLCGALLASSDRVASDHILLTPHQLLSPQSYIYYHDPDLWAQQWRTPAEDLASSGTISEHHPGARQPLSSSPQLPLPPSALLACRLSQEGSTDVGQAASTDHHRLFSSPNKGIELLPLASTSPPSAVYRPPSPQRSASPASEREKEWIGAAHVFRTPLSDPNYISGDTCHRLALGNFLSHLTTHLKQTIT